MPQSGEWGIDRLAFSVAGQWRATNADDGFAYFEQRLTDEGGPQWLQRQVTRYGVSIETRKIIPFTIGRIKVTATGCSGREGKLTVDATVNPTRTLASLLARFGEHDDFRARIFRMDAPAFFQALPEGQVPRSLDGRDNYLPEQPSVRGLLGSDPFAAFMPIYLRQLQELLERVLSEQLGEVSFDVAEQVFTSHGGTIRLDWGNPYVKQIETYFERFHRRAEAAVRRAGTAIIDGDPHAAIRSYPGVPTLERAADCFRVSVDLALDRRHTLAIYAKTEQRIRFEVRRRERGRYEAPISEHVANSGPRYARLLHILLDVERYDANRLVRWGDLFGAFDEPDVPNVGDLTALLTQIFVAADHSEALFKLLLDRLVVDGGISGGLDDRIPDTAIQRLRRAGVIVRSHVRRRDPVGQKPRYRLAGDFQWLRQRLLTALASSDADMAV